MPASIVIGIHGLKIRLQRIYWHGGGRCRFRKGYNVIMARVTARF